MAAATDKEMFSPPRSVFETPPSSRRGPYKRQESSSCRKSRWVANKKSRLFSENIVQHDVNDDPETTAEDHDILDHLNEGSPENSEGENYLSSFDASKEPYQTYADREESSFSDLCDHDIMKGFVRRVNNIYEGVVSSCSSLQNRLMDTVRSSCEELLLYVGSRLTLSASMLLIVAFSTRHNLTATALSDLLQLVEIHCPASNNFKGTLKLFKDYFEDVKEPISQHFYCSYCQKLYGKDIPTTCDICGKKDFSSFLSLPLESQLTSIFKALDTKDVPIAKANTSSSDKISDVVDGKLYRDHFNKDGYFHGTTKEQHDKEIHVSLQLNTDGVAIFKSSTFSIWPLYAVVNELSPSSRYSRENRIFMGLWYGNAKPNMNIFLRPFVKELQSLYSEGFPYHTEQGAKIVVRMIVLSAVADAPARCLLLNCMQFNGKFGCPCCYAPGEQHKTSEHGHSRIYPTTDVTPNLRTDVEMEQIGKDVERNFKNGKSSVPVPEYGIKGRSPMAKLPKFNLVRGMSVDYMHCVLLGVMKMLLTLWFDVSHRAQPFSIRKHLATVNERLTYIKPPNFFNRIPRNVDDIGQWKASEFRTFLLFFGIPVLSGLLPLAHFSHFCLLSQAIFLLLQQSIDRSDIDCARDMLLSFCQQIEGLYGARYQTFNVHSLLHLADKVVDLGPLWAHSCFFFEDLNGDLRNLFHGTTHVHNQVMLAVSIQQQIPLLQKTLDPQSEAAQLYEAMTSKRTVSKKENITEGISVVGRIDPAELSYRNLHLVNQKIPNSGAYEIFYRLKFHRRVIHSMDYSVVKTRNTYTIICNDGSVGFVKCFLKCYKDDGQVDYAALINVLEHVSADVYPVNLLHCKIVRKGPNMRVIFIRDIKDVCICIDQKDIIYAFTPPNSVEKE